MPKNITLRLDETVLRRARLEAVKKDLSLSKWLVGLIEQAVEADPQYEAARRKAFPAHGRGFSPGREASDQGRSP